MSFGFDLTNVSVEENLGGCLPAGTYTAKIERVEKRVSKTNANNKYLNVMYKVSGMASRNGAVFFDTVNIHNESEKAQDIGRKRLKSMMVSAGAPDDKINELGPDFLLNKIVTCVVGVEKSEGYEDKNKVFQVLPSDNSKSEPQTTSAPSGWV